MARQIPLAISVFSLLLAIKEITSDSANTEHILVISMSSVDCKAIVPSSLISTSNVLAIISRKRPVPAAHLSFITKSMTSPLSLNLIPLLSCPPISKIVRIFGLK